MAEGGALRFIFLEYVKGKDLSQKERGKSIYIRRELKEKKEVKVPLNEENTGTMEALQRKEKRGETYIFRLPSVLSAGGVSFSRGDGGPEGGGT